MTPGIKAAVRLAATLAVSLVIGAAARAEEPKDAPKHGGTLTAIIQPEPVTLTSAFNSASVTGIVNANIFDGLVKYDRDLKPQPELAESWDVSPDGLTITFHLRKGITWHDGVPFTSADVKWSLENVWKPLHPRNPGLFRNIREAETPDDNTVIFHLTQPSVALLGLLNANGAQILPKHLYEGTDLLNNPYNNKPVGTGAFVFKEWSRGNYITLERNPNYWDKDRPYLDRIIFKVIPDAGARAAAIEKGEVQYATLSPVPLRDAERISKLPHVRITTDGYDWIAPFLYFDLNVDRPYLKDVRVRRAIAYAIDREALRKIVWFGFGKPADSPVPSAAAAFHHAAVTYPFDPKKAESLLDDAGFKRGPNGVRFTLTHDYLPYGDDYKRTGEFLKQALKRIGIEVTIRGQDTATFTKRVYGDRDFDISSSWAAAFSDPQIGVNRLYWSGFVGKNVPWTNGSGYRNPKIDAIIAQTEREPSAAKRIALFKDFQRIVEEDEPTIPLLELRFFTVYAANLKNVVSRGDQIFGSLRDAWLDDPAKQN